MPGPTDQSPTREILTLLDGPPYEPFTAREVADRIGRPLDTVREELNHLVGQEVLRTKEIDGHEPVWWLARREGVDGGGAGPAHSASNGSDDRDGAPDQRLLDQHRQLAQFVTRIDITDDVDEILRQITVEARELVGAHQSVTSRTLNQDWEQAINEVSLSDKYDGYQEYDTEPDGSGIYSVVCERNEPMRMTQAELESHPSWNDFGDDTDEHPPMDGWLAVPIIGPDDENRGLIQLSDKYHGEFTEADEAILTQLANVASAAIENARLYAELHESEERYRTLVENFPDGAVTLYDDDLRYIAAGGDNVQRIGETADSLTGRDLEDALPEELASQLIPHYRTAIEEEEQQSFVAEYDDTYYLFRAVPVRDEEGDVYAGMGISQDITERQEYRRRLEESNRRLEQFAHAASHDLQEPLRMVSSYLRLLESRYDDELDEDAQEFIDFAVDGADRMRTMVDALLEYSRVESRGDPFEPVDLNAVLADVREDLQVKLAESDAELTVAELPCVRGDADQLRQVSQNLLENAIKYSGDEPPRIHVDAERAGTEWVVSVHDEGIGIEPDYTDQIFQVFEQLHTSDDYSGTGMGLALCERIVERHGGSIWVESEPGDGSMVSFTLPAGDDCNS